MRLKSSVSVTSHREIAVQFLMTTSSLIMQFTFELLQPEQLMVTEVYHGYPEDFISYTQVGGWRVISRSGHSAACAGECQITAAPRRPVSCAFAMVRPSRPRSGLPAGWAATLKRSSQHAGVKAANDGCVSCEDDQRMYESVCVSLGNFWQPCTFSSPRLASVGSATSSYGKQCT